MRDKLIELIRGKNVHIATHWDADGVTSGALVYHLIKPYAKNITKRSKGRTFLIEPSDVDANAEVIICTDIQPSDELKSLPSNPKIAYIDHHPAATLDYAFVIHDPNAVSASILVYDNFFSNTQDPYVVFLALIGYFGDRGKIIPYELENKAKKLLGSLMDLRPSNFGKPFYEIERFVSLMNTGKRMNWSGDEPLDLLTSVNRVETLFAHEIFSKLCSYKQELRDAYDTEVTVNSLGKVDFIFISNPKNIQGVVAARHMGDKPVIVINHYDNELIGSMRVPDNKDFNAGSFLEQFNGKVNGFLGGGHEKAAGFNLPPDSFNQFFELLKQLSIS